MLLIVSSFYCLLCSVSYAGNPGPRAFVGESGAGWHVDRPNPATLIPVQQLALQSVRQRNSQTVSWSELGFQDGMAGANEQTVKKRQQRYADYGFDPQAYLRGWLQGNDEFWRSLGRRDAAEGVSDRVLASYIKQAQQRQLRLRQQIYQAAYDNELVEYWRRLARQDAVHGRDLSFRSDFAKRRGLRFERYAYQQAWENQLETYWQEAGRVDGRNRQFNLTQQLERARLDDVFVLPQSAEWYKQAWRAENSEYCSERRAYEEGRKTQVFDFAACAEIDQSDLRKAFEQGQHHEHILPQQRQKQAEIKKADELIAQLQKQIAQAQQELERADKSRSEQQTQRERNWQKQVAQTQAELQNKERQQKDMGQELREILDKKQKLSRELEQVEQELHRSRERRQSDGNDEQEKSKRRLQDLQKDRNYLERDIESERRKVSDIDQEIKHIKEKLKDKKESESNSSDLQRKERERSDAQSEIKQLQEKVSRLRQSEEQVQNEAGRTRGNFSKPGYDEERWQRKRKELNEELEKVTRQIDEARQKNSHADTELRRAQELRREANNRSGNEPERNATNLVTERQRELAQLKRQLQQAQEYRARLSAEEKNLR